eukprot:GEMP01024821.1.p1 GENE.GEMP01024821.1~~GEMP01024821.1.p1  ORF type:complete len:536 (+),score=139.72 GEMP01024821.1:130-1737(+)
MEEATKAVRTAREEAVLGNYSAAVNSYEDALLQIQRAQSSNARAKDRYANEQWVKCKAELTDEMDLAKQLEQQWRTFDLPSHTPKPAAKSRGLLDDFLTDAVNQPPPPRRTDREDPSIWSPPPDRKRTPPLRDYAPARKDYDGIGRGARPKAPPKSSASAPVRQQRNISPVPGAPTVVAAATSSRSRNRDYNRPWAVPEVQMRPEESQQQGVSSFLKSLYGESGQGPDADLARQMEEEILERNPGVSWSHIAGLEEAIKLLREAVILPLKMPNFFTGIRRPWKGILVFGPPGTGKTTLARAVATECDTSFINVSVGALASKWRGDSEKMIRLLFKMARHYAPSTIFIDEIDAIGGKRGDSNEAEASRRVKTELLVQMDGINTSSSKSDEDEGPKLVTVLAATNRPWDLDEALRRRLEKRIYIPLPDAAGRKKVFEINVESLKLGPGIDLDGLTERSSGYSCADISVVCRDAAMMGLRRAQDLGLSDDEIARLFENGENEVTMEDFIGALSNVQKSVSSLDLDEFTKWQNEFGSKT